MIERRRPQPPRLLVKTLAVTFLTVAILLSVVFVVVTVSVRRQVRESVQSNLEAGQRIFAQLEARRQRELRTQAATLAESPRLKAALEVYQLEGRSTSADAQEQVVNTMEGELGHLASAIDADALVVVDPRGRTIASAGRMASRWPPDKVAGFGGADGGSFDGVVHAGTDTFRTVAVPLEYDDTTIATLYPVTILDRRYAEDLAKLAATRTAIVSDGLIVGTTLAPEAARQFESAVARGRQAEGLIELAGESFAFRRLVQVGSDTTFYALGSIDESSRAKTRAAMLNLAYLALGATALALGASFWLARMLSEPIGGLSRSIAAIAASHDVEARLPLTGSSREVDSLTETFNTMLASIGAAEAQTEAAYTGAIRALATALDARDPYTAGHSERVSVLSVALGRALAPPADDVEVLRLGALLHDIGKIGVPDQVLRKPGALTDAEFDFIRQHPVLGARILRSVPFLGRHIPIVELHHERPDGRGYPRGLRGDDIPMAARIVHVADAYDAITSARAYRGARASGEAIRELWRCAGTEFHAEIVGALAVALPGVITETSAIAEPVGG